jgi:beta-galactosidase
MAARIDKRPSPDDRKKAKNLEVARFVIRYSDGKTADVPVYAEVHLEGYRQKTPLALPGSQIAWTRKYEGSDESAVAYSVQWTNPRPDAEISSIDMKSGADRAGVAALLAVTAAK